MVQGLRTLPQPICFNYLLFLSILSFKSGIFLQINALCMAFYARSEEARQTHSIHKLALVDLFGPPFCWPQLNLLTKKKTIWTSCPWHICPVFQGALALEDALSNGLPVRAELEALHSYIESVDKDSLLQLALSSLPEDVRLHGTDSPLQLNEKASGLN